MVDQTIQPPLRKFQGGKGMGFPVVPQAANYTVPREESSTTYVATAADVIFTLPPSEKGLIFTFLVAATGLSVALGLKVAVNGTDRVMGNGFTSANSKGAVNSGATDREGDSITLEGDGNLGWYITSVIGTWAREA